MRYISTLALAATVLPVLLLPGSVLAQKFHEPTREELQMTSDPKAPGASAVFLDVSETADDSLHLLTYYARIKVLTEAGKAAGAIEIERPRGDFSITDVRPKVVEGSGDWMESPSGSKSKGSVPAEDSDPWTGLKITDFKARTIHPDGTAIPFLGKIEDVAVPRASARPASESRVPGQPVPDRQTGSRFIQLPSVEVGSILEYSYQIRYDEHHFASPYWGIQHPYFVHQAHYSFKPYKIFLNLPDNSSSSYLVDSRGNVVNVIIGWPVLPPGIKVQSDNIGYFTLDMKDIPPIQREEWMPPASAFSYHVRFYYKNALTEKEFWTAENARWTREVDRLAEPTPAIRQAVSAIVAPGDSDLEKARKLYVAVQALDNVDFSKSKAAPWLLQAGSHLARRAEVTLSQKGGSREDIAILYLAMLRAAGVTAFDMRVVNRDRGAFSQGYLSPDQFDDNLILASINGKEIVLDPGAKMCPFQTVDWKHQGASGLRQSPAGVVAAATPSSTYVANTLLRSGDITLDAQANFTGLFHFVMKGQRALDWRQQSLSSSPEEVKKQFDTWLGSIVPAGVEAHLDHFLALDNPDLNLVAIVNLKGSSAAGTSSGLAVPRTIFETASHHPFVEEATREEPVDMQYAEQITDQVVYHLPAGLALQQLAQDSTLPWAGHAVLAIKTKTTPGQISVTRSFTRAFTIAKPDDYPKLHDFFQNVAAADRQQLVLTSAAAASSN
jgi:hypothetical protein